MHLRNLKSGLSFQKRSHDPVPRPFRGEFFTPGVGLAVVDPLAKFKEYSFKHSRNIDGHKNFEKGRVTQTTLLRWDLLAAVDPFAKFNKRSFIHSRNIEGGLKF